MAHAQHNRKKDRHETALEGFLATNAHASSSTPKRFESVVGGLRADLYRYAYWLSRDSEQAQDVVQETMLRAWRSFDSLADERAVKSWLFTIVRNENNRIYARKRLDTVDIDELNTQVPELSVSPDAADRSDLHAVLGQLDPVYREPLVLQVLMGHSSKEIGEIIGITPDAVNTRLFRARQKLHALFSETNGVGSTLPNTVSAAPFLVA